MRRLTGRWSWLAPAGWILASCVQLSTGDGTGSRSTRLAADAAPDVAPAGAGCITDAQSGVVLCERLDACPGLLVDPGAFPDCGFRLNAGTPIAIECLCSNALCPLGLTTGCDEARTLLAAQNALLVCAQIAEGRCVDLSAGAPSRASPCDRTCAGQCGGAPSCLQLCGC